MKKIIITGATGLIGKKLSDELHKSGYHIIVFSRDSRRAKDILKKDYEYIEWDYGKPENWIEKISDSDAVIHLAGINLFAKRWNDHFKKEIITSRRDTTRSLADAIKNSSNKPKVFVSASGVGYYGDGGDKILTEDSPAGNDFLAEVCKVWESEAAEVENVGVRRVSIRTGIVLSPEDGALKRMLLPFKLFIGGPLGNGKQWFPWIHIDDIVGVYRHAIENEKLSGAVNAAAPNICTMNEFAKTLGKVLNRPSLFPVPGFALKLAIGEAGDVVLMGQRVSVNKLLSSGYKFKFENLEEALNDLLM
ncbi:TIGR01777 family oxidoreductase [Ignavibacterium album]|uniref:TIGR01777 family oxidoreductase n=1 Tax=Ignavibacterium album TaxID=591197 RepID=UPI0026EC26E8|nr:TIGR01777 family oxidoreductase [Ignavibacterium album]